MKYIAVIGQFAVFLAVIFIVGQAAIIPVQDTLRKSDNVNVTNSQGDVVVDGPAFFDRGQRLVFQWMPYMIMIGIPTIAALWYMRFTSIRQGGPGGF